MAILVPIILFVALLISVIMLGSMGINEVAKRGK